MACSITKNEFFYNYTLEPLTRKIDVIKNYVKLWMFAEGEGYHNQASANKEGVGFKFWSFCDNVITECPRMLLYYNKRII